MRLPNARVDRLPPKPPAQRSLLAQQHPRRREIKHSRRIESELVQARGKEPLRKRCHSLAVVGSLGRTAGRKKCSPPLRQDRHAEPGRWDENPRHGAHLCPRSSWWMRGSSEPSNLAVQESPAAEHGAASWYPGANGGEISRWRRQSWQTCRRLCSPCNRRRTGIWTRKKLPP